MADISSMLAEAERAYLIAAAGYGKTEEIAKAVALSTNGRQLVLTHTHAGVRSLRNRFKALGVPSSNYHLDTIAGWALRSAASYPTRSGITDSTPTGDAWKEVYQASANLLDEPFFRQVLQISYAGVYVDEYQDCVASQHRLILGISEILPCRILLDPLQGIFDFQRDDPIVKWKVDIEPNFQKLPELTTPWRWRIGNRQLGNWLSAFRHALLRGESIDLRKSPVQWLPKNPTNQRQTCFDFVKTGEKSVVAIHKWPQSAHRFASRLRGTFTSMEEMESKDLLTWSSEIDQFEGTARVVAIIDFAAKCMTRVSSELRSARNSFEKGKMPNIASYKKHQNVIQALLAVTSTNDLAPVLSALHLIGQIDGAVLYRRELWNEMPRAIRAYQTGDFDSLQDAAWHIRDQARRYGRKVDYRTVARTLLIKGLEFDHAIVLDADQLDDAKNLYVAMTRGAKSLVVLSKSPIIVREPFGEL